MRGRLAMRITPDDVGRRVSVRSRLAGAPAGPTTTDTVGRLLAWTDSGIIVERRDGTRAELPLVDVLAAKVIPESPPRPPAR